MSEMGHTVVAGWPLAGALAMALVAERLRMARRRESLNRALHELRRPLQLLALAPRAVPGGSSTPLQLAIAAMAQLDREINGGVAPVVADPVRLSQALDNLIATRWSMEGRT